MADVQNGPAGLQFDALDVPLESWATQSNRQKLYYCLISRASWGNRPRFQATARFLDSLCGMLSAGAPRVRVCAVQPVSGEFDRC